MGLARNVAAGGVLRSGTAVSASGTSVDFTSIPSWVKRITVMFSGVSTNGTSLILIRIGAGSFDTSGYISTVAGVAASTAFTNTQTAGFHIGGGAASYTQSGSVSLTLIDTNSWVASGVAKQDTNVVQMIAGNKSISGTLDRVRITTVNGTDTFDAGTINILYE